MIRPTLPTPRLPHVSLPSVPVPQLPRITGTPLRKAVPYALVAAQLFVLAAPLAAPALAPLHAARLLTAARYTALLLALVR